MIWDFRKIGANLTSDLLIFDFWGHFCPKKHKIPQKVIVFLIQNWNQIKLKVLDIWIGRWINFFVNSVYFARFRTPSCGKLGPKSDQKYKLWVRHVVVKVWLFQKALYITYIPIRTTCGSNFSLVRRFLWKLLPQNPPKLGPIGWGTKKNSCIFRVKWRTANTQKLKLVDLETMCGWLYYRLCENWCWPFGRAPGGQFRPNFCNCPKLHQQSSHPSQLL